MYGAKKRNKKDNSGSKIYYSETFPNSLYIN